MEEPITAEAREKLLIENLAKAHQLEHTNNGLTRKLQGFFIVNECPVDDLPRLVYQDIWAGFNESIVSPKYKPCVRHTGEKTRWVSDGATCEIVYYWSCEGGGRLIPGHVAITVTEDTSGVSEVIFFVDVNVKELSDHSETLTVRYKKCYAKLGVDAHCFLGTELYELDAKEPDTELELPKTWLYFKDAKRLFGFESPCDDCQSHPLWDEDYVRAASSAPDWAKCQLTGVVMKNPVVHSHSTVAEYDDAQRDKQRRWTEDVLSGVGESPSRVRKPYLPKVNHALSAAISDWIERNSRQAQEEAQRKRKKLEETAKELIKRAQEVMAEFGGSEVKNE